MIESAPVETVVPVTESLPCCPCPSCDGGEVIASAPVTESLPCCEGTGEAYVEPGISSEVIVDEGTVVSEGTIVDEGTVITGSDYTVVDDGAVMAEVTGDVIGDTSGETIISEEIISTDVIGSSEDSTTTDESGDSGAADTSTDLLDDFAPDASPSPADGVYKKSKSKVRFVFVRTHSLAKKKAAEKRPVRGQSKTSAKPVLRLSFSSTRQK